MPCTPPDIDDEIVMRPQWQVAIILFVLFLLELAVAWPWIEFR